MAELANRKRYGIRTTVLFRESGHFQALAFRLLGSYIQMYPNTNFIYYEHEK